MAKKSGSIMFKCSNCGYTQPRWLGRCPDCGEWNSLEEIIIDKNAVSPAGKGSEQAIKQKPVNLNTIKAQGNSRISTGIEEFDRVLGGGATKCSAVLLGGDPGIGKSTLLLQTLSSISNQTPSTLLYISGEESAAQIKERADRLGLKTDGIQILCTNRLEDSLDAMDALKPSFIIIDSIQTIYSAEAGIIPGTVNQLKYCANEFISWVKERDSVLIMTEQHPQQHPGTRSRSYARADGGRDLLPLCQGPCGGGRARLHQRAVRVHHASDQLRRGIHLLGRCLVSPASARGRLQRHAAAQGRTGSHRRPRGIHHRSQRIPPGELRRPSGCG